MYFQILNLPPEIRSKYEYLEVYGILNGIHPADTTLLYDKLVDELEELWETGCGAWDAFSEEYALVRCMLLGVIMDYKGLVDAGKRMDVNAYKCCMLCRTKGCHSPALGRIFYAFFKQHPPGPPENYTHEFVKRMGEIHEALSKSGWSKSDMAERFSATGFKLPAAFARLSYFNLALDWLYDPMHEIMNLGNRLATTLLGLDFNEAARNFAEEEGLHPEWGQTEWVQNSKGEPHEVYKMTNGPWGIPPRPKASTTLRSRETALAFLKELRGVTRWGDGHKHLLRTSTASNGAKYAKHLKAHEALKAFESKLLAVLSSWPGDDGEVDNALQDIVSKLTIIIRECNAHSIEPRDMEYLREQTRLFFEDLEANGPPQWLAINTHKIWHWADLLLRFGPVREWWMYAFESMNGKLARWVKNNAFPVASIMNGYLRLKTLRSLRGILTMLLNRKRATAGRVPRALMARPAPGIVVTTFGEKGKPLELTSLEIDQLTRWMRASIPAYRKLFQQHAEYDLFRRRENAARSKQALRNRQEVGVVPAIAFGPLEDPEGWLGRQYTAYEKSLMMGPEPMCSKYNKVNIGGVFYRTRDGDRVKVTTQCFVRASFPKDDADADDEWEDRYGIINAILRVTIGGVLYTFLKCDWLPVPTEAQIASFKLKNSILGVDKVSKAYCTFNPWDTSKYTMGNREPYLLANQVQAQVVIVKHPCMDSAVILDTSDRNMEKLALVDRPVVSDGHFDTCGKCRVGGELLLCERAGCKEAMHVDDVGPVPLQSARVTTTAATDGEFPGFVQTVNHAAIQPVDLTGYDTDDYEDHPDGSFTVKPRATQFSANYASAPAAGELRSDPQRTYGCGKPPWGFPATVGPWGIPYFISIILFISIMGVGAAAITAANDVDHVQVSGQAAPQPVLCRGDLCIYPGISELDLVTLDAVLHYLGAAAVAHRLPEPLECRVLQAATVDIVVTD
ncbi:hypothetical protein CYMTET_51378 [Cymbomonas tetramitiformis]|uniref:Uncharacterized protein n=1 Tax=Cymbomonas tetramitiformis TaxID=36881 RepID=A0AAE0BMD6_9CHLO|nr:hypothetical protein CYMTET_51378 [Cymbomonas tetramitiformis]